MTDEPTPEPGWWMATDGQLYPPEVHPDADTGLPTSPPRTGPTTDPGPAYPGDGTSTVPGPHRAGISKRGLVAGIVGGFLGAIAIAAVALGVVVSYRMFIAIPSPQADREHLESVLPGDEDVAPGLIPQDSTSAASNSNGQAGHADSGDCSTGVAARASAEVGYFESAGAIGTKGFVLHAFSYQSDSDAEHDVEAIDQNFVDQCFGDEFIAANRTTGGADGASSSAVIILEGLGGKVYLVAAQRDRFAVVALAVDADRALDLASETLAKL